MKHERAKETSISKLRNILSPVSNYFEVMELSKEQKEKLPEDYLEKSRIQALESFREAVVLIKDDSKWI